MNSPTWKNYCFSHKIAQLLLIVDLTTYFSSNKIKVPWDQHIEAFSPELNVVTRKTVDSLIEKLIQHKILKSTKSVYGSYLRGNHLIGDLDILLDIK